MADHTADDGNGINQEVVVDEGMQFPTVNEPSLFEKIMGRGTGSEKANDVDADMRELDDGSIVASGSPGDDYVALNVGDGVSAVVATGAGDDTIQVYDGDYTIVPGPDDDHIELNGGTGRIVLQADDGSQDTISGYENFADGEVGTGLFVGFEPNLNGTLTSDKPHDISISTEFSNSQGNLEIHFNNKVSGGTSEITFDGVTQDNFGGLDVVPTDDVVYGVGNQINVLLKP